MSTSGDDFNIEVRGGTAVGDNRDLCGRYGAIGGVWNGLEEDIINIDDTVVVEIVEGNKSSCTLIVCKGGGMGNPLLCDIEGYSVDGNKSTPV